MRWETGVAIFLAPIAADLMRRWRNYDPPFDEEWTIARVLGLFRLGRDQRGERATPLQIGSDGLRALPPPLAHEESAGGGAVEEAPTDIGGERKRHRNRGIG